MDKIYYDPSHPASFGGVEKLQKASKLPKKVVEEWIKYQDVPTLHHALRKKFKTNRIKVLTIDHQWQADLCDMQKLEQHNRGYNYLLTCIDIFSKNAWAIPLKSKHSSEIIRAFKKIFKTKRKCIKLQTDKGTEFTNAPFQKFLAKNDVAFFTANNNVKASVVERFNRTLKTKMWKYFTHKNTRKYIDVLPKLLNSYNNTFHKSIKMTPNSVKPSNVIDVHQNLYPEDFDKKEKAKFKFNVGDKVRISREKGKFEKGYEANYSEEIYVIVERLPRKPPVYKLHDLKGKPFDAIFYEPELIKVQTKADKVYPIEVIDQQGDQAYIKWVGYPASFNEWMPAEKVLKL